MPAAPMAAPLAADPSPAPTTPSGLSRWTPALPTGLISMLNPFAPGSTSSLPADSPNAQDNAAAARPTSKKRAAAAALHSAAARSPSPSRSADSVMFAEPETGTNSDCDSREGSVDGPKRSKKNKRPKTCYSVCHAPPASSRRQKMHRRPRSLLQLHRLQPSARPLPAFDVIPSANFSVRLTRAITRVFKAKHGLCPNDLVVLQAEKYSTEDEDDEDDEEVRHVIGLICKGRKEEGAAAGKAKIYLASGKEWDAYPLAKGGYEFSHTDEHGLVSTVRWVLKRNKDGHNPKRRRFNFSTISPNTRRHPVIATLGTTALEINDKYKMPDAGATTPSSTPKQASTILTHTLEEEEGDVGTIEQCETDESLRELITMTGIWVTFKEGWSPTLKYDDKDKDRDCSSVPGSPGMPHPLSKAAGSPMSTPPGSPVKTRADQRHSIKSISSGVLRRSSMLSTRTRVSVSSLPSIDAEPPAGTLSRSNSVVKTGRARGDSTSTVLVHRAASNRRKNNQHATWRPDLLAAQAPLNETSREDLTSTPPARARDLAPSPSPMAQRRASVPELLDPSPTTPNLSPSKPTASSSSSAVASSEKRESSATEDTSTTENSLAGSPTKHAPVGDKGINRKTKRGRSGWRRLLCGSHDL